MESKGAFTKESIDQFCTSAEQIGAEAANIAIEITQESYKDSFHQKLFQFWERSHYESIETGRELAALRMAVHKKFVIGFFRGILLMAIPSFLIAVWAFNLAAAILIFLALAIASIWIGFRSV